MNTKAMYECPAERPQVAPQPVLALQVGDRVVSVNGMVTFTEGDGCVLPVGVEGVIVFALEGKAQPYRVKWDNGKTWYHSADQLKHAN